MFSHVNCGFFVTENTEWLRTIFIWHSELLPQAILLHKLKGLYYKMSLLITLGDITIFFLKTTCHLQDVSDTVIFLFPSFVHLKTGQLQYPHLYFLHLHFDKIFPPALYFSSNQNLYGYCECFLSLLKFSSHSHCLHVAEKCWYKYPFAIILKLSAHVLDP